MKTDESILNPNRICATATTEQTNITQGIEKTL